MCTYYIHRGLPCMPDLSRQKCQEFVVTHLYNPDTVQRYEETQMWCPDKCGKWWGGSCQALGWLVRGPKLEPDLKQNIFSICVLLHHFHFLLLLQAVNPSENWHEAGQAESRGIMASYVPPFSSKRCHFPWPEIECHRGTSLNYYFTLSTSIAVHSSICLYQGLSSYLKVYCKSSIKIDITQFAGRLVLGSFRLLILI